MQTSARVQAMGEDDKGDGEEGVDYAKYDVHSWEACA